METLGIFDQLIDALTVLGVLILPVALTLVCEELIFGGLVRLLLAPQPEASKRSERSTQGETQC